MDYESLFRQSTGCNQLCRGETSVAAESTNAWFDEAAATSYPKLKVGNGPETRYLHLG